MTGWKEGFSRSNENTGMIYEGECKAEEVKRLERLAESD